MVKKQCSTCNFYVCRKCCRRAPVVGKENDFAVFPLVKPWEWCGEYEQNSSIIDPEIEKAMLESFDRTEKRFKDQQMKNKKENFVSIMISLLMIIALSVFLIVSIIKGW